MKKSNPQIDAYIAKAAPFARPILEKIRSLFHEACPEIQESLKWSFPHFEHKGIVGSMAGFKAHVSFGFWRGSELKDPHGLFRGIGKTQMCAMRLTEISQLPSDKIMLETIREAASLNESGAPAARPKKTKPALKVPPYFMAALRKNKKAMATFEAFSPSQKREYVEWVVDAKQEETRQRRLETAVEWMAQGKPRNWKYMKKPVG